MSRRRDCAPSTKLQHSYANGCQTVPRLAAASTDSTLIRVSNGWAEAQSWIPGAPLNQAISPFLNGRKPNTGYRCSVKAHQQIATALAIFHASTADLQLSTDIEYTPLDQILAPVRQTATKDLMKLRVQYRTQNDDWPTQELAILES